MKTPYDRPIFLRAVKTLVRVTLSDSFRIRPPSIYRAPGIARPSAQMGGLGGSEIQCFWTQLWLSKSVCDRFNFQRASIQSAVG